MSSTESPVSVTVKTQAGSLVTLRAESPSEFVDLILAATNEALFGPAVQDFENLVRGTQSIEAAAVANTGGTVVNFAPVAPPAQAATVAGQRNCAHGVMTYREGMGAKGPWKGYFCPERDKNQQCKPQWLK